MNNIIKMLDSYENIFVQNNDNGKYSKRILVSIHQFDNIKHNHRKIGIPELVFDIDCHVTSLSKEIVDDISNNLRNDGVFHSVWDTSRSYHIHCFFIGLNLLSQELRREFKIFLMKKYSGKHYLWVDKSKASENTMIREFNSKHEITGKLKTLVWDYSTHDSVLNPIRASDLKDFMKTHKTLNQTTNESRVGFNGGLNEHHQQDLRDFLEFAQKTKFPKSGMQKNNIYFKNIAIASYLLNLDDKSVKHIFKKIADNCRPHTSENMYNWLKWCKIQKHELKVNFKEVNNFYDYSTTNK